MSSSTDLSAQLEAVLFVATGPLTEAELAAATGCDTNQVETALAALSQRLTGGTRLSVNTGSYRLVTAPETSAIVRKFLQDEAKSELTKAALETLAIVAYRGPLTKTGVEEIRGVASETMLRNLQARGLITEAGRSSEPGRPRLYAVSHTFLQQFGLTSTAELPPLPNAAAEAGQ
jgi:segregation and condensation protein B